MHALPSWEAGEDSEISAETTTIPGARVCHITTVHAPTDTRIFHRQCLSLARAGYDVHVVAPCEADQELQGVHIHALPRPPGRLRRMLIWPWLAYAKVRELSPPPALCHLHDPELLLMGQVLRLDGCRVVFDVHENIAGQILDKRYMPMWVRRVLSWAYRRVEGLLVRGLGTVHVLDSIAQHYRPPKAVVRNLPARPASVEPPAAAPRSGPVQLIYVGEISRDRGAMVMVQVVAELARRGLLCNLRMIGPIYEPRLGEQIGRAVAQAGLQGAVTLTGRLPHEQAMAHVAGATIGLCLLAPLPNYLNSLPTKVFEYMRASLPVVASDFECWRPYLADAGTGVQVSPDNVPAMADAIERLLDDPAAMARMGERGRQAVQSQFCWENEETKLLTFYESLLGPSPTPAR